MVEDPPPTDITADTAQPATIHPTVPHIRVNPNSSEGLSRFLIATVLMRPRYGIVSIQ